MGLLDRLVPQSLKSRFDRPSELLPVQGYKTFTEQSPFFHSWDGTLYEQAQTRAIIECIATACSKLKPEFVTPEGSQGSIPRVQKLFTAWPNDVMDWPTFLRRVFTILLTETTAYVVPGYDDRDGSIISLWPMKPSYTEVVDYEGEPWMRFHLLTGEVQAYPFYDVAILTRFQLDSDIYGGGNKPLTPTLRLMDAQRQAEEIALKTGADIRFIGKLTTLTHEDDLEKKRNRFAESNLSPRNKSGLMLYDSTIDELKQVNPQNFTIDPDEMSRIDKALYSYFTINEKILSASFTEAEWAAFYELCIEPKAIALGAALTKMLLTPTQVRKGNHIMFSSGYLEYATPESKLKVATNGLDRGVYTINEVRDIFQLPHIPGGDVRMIRGEYYIIDDLNNIIAESGGKSKHDTTTHTVDQPSDDDTDTYDDSDVADEIDDLTRRLVALMEKRAKVAA